MAKVYRAQASGVGDAPDYVIRNGRFYRTVHHPAGWSETADMEIRDDGKIYQLDPGGASAGQVPIYEFRDIMLYRTDAHPNGAGVQPDYYIYD